MSKNDKKSSWLAWFLAGVAAGSLVSLLYAPDNGAGTRKKLTFNLKKYKEKLEKLLADLLNEKVTPLASEARSKGDKVVAVTRDKAERLLEDVDDLISQIGDSKS